MRRLLLILAVSGAALSVAAPACAWTSHEQAGRLVKSYFDRHPEAKPPTAHAPHGPGSTSLSPGEISNRVLGKRFVWFDNGRRSGAIGFSAGGQAEDDWQRLPQSWMVAADDDLLVSTDGGRWVTRLTLNRANGHFYGGRDASSQIQDGVEVELFQETPGNVPPDANAAATPPVASAPPVAPPVSTPPPPPPPSLPYGATPQCRDLFLSGMQKGSAGDARGAIQLYAQALKLCQRLCPAMNNTGAAYNALGDRKNAKIWFDAGSRCDPNNPTFKANAASMR